MQDVFVQYGCGFVAPEGWHNFDASPTLRIERIPFFGSLFSAAFSGNQSRFPLAAKYGDIRKGPLVAAGTAKGVYASHVLEHLSLSDCRIALANTLSMMDYDGVFRLVVPDLLERARQYIVNQNSDTHASISFIRGTLLGKEHRVSGLIGSIREIAGNSNHLWMWDAMSMEAELRAAGFDRVRRCEMGDSEFGEFNQIEERSRFYNEELGIRECAMEAKKPSRNLTVA